LTVKHMTPVLLLSDGFVANGTEPWKLPDVDKLPEIPVTFHSDPEGFMPYARDPQTLARPWAVPGTPRLEHRLGGLEKSDGTGNVSYDPKNHERMVRLRAEKVERVADDIPAAELDGRGFDEGLLVVSWGSTYGATTSAVRRAQKMGLRVSHVHLRYLNPLPKNVGALLQRYDRVLVPEINLGQLAFILQGRFLKPIDRLNKVQGQPFMASEILDKIREIAEAN